MEEQLIALLRQCEFLYRKSDKRYKNTYLREKKWVEISTNLGVEGKHFIIAYSLRAFVDCLSAEFPKTSPRGSLNDVI